MEWINTRPMFNAIEVDWKWNKTSLIGSACRLHYGRTWSELNFGLWNPTLCYRMSRNPYVILTAVPLTRIYEDINWSSKQWDSFKIQTKSHNKSTPSNPIRVWTGGLEQSVWNRGLEQGILNIVSGTGGLEQRVWIGPVLTVSCEMISELHNLVIAEELDEIFNR